MTEYVQDPKTETWHLAYFVSPDGGRVRTWCNISLDFPDPKEAQYKTPVQVSFMDVIHDECYRKANE